jgi:dienelactone hydrolase
MAPRLLITLAIPLAGFAQKAPPYEPEFQYHFGSIAVPKAHAAEPVAPFSFQRGLDYLENGAAVWVRQAKCVSCHTSGTYLLVRSQITRQAGPPSREIRDFFASMLDRYDAEKPEWFTGFRPQQIVYTAAGLAEYDANASGKLSAETDRAIRKMLSVQTGGGAWTNDTCWPPLESSVFHGATIAARAIAVAPGWKATAGPELLGRVAKLHAYLRSDAAQHDYDRVSLLWTSAVEPSLMTAAEKQRVIETIRRKQRSDGGWSMRAFAAPAQWGDGKRAARIESEPDAADPASDGHMTGLALTVLNAHGIHAGDPAVRRGLAWLERNQRASGRWWTKSLNTDKWNYITYSGSAYPMLALARYGRTSSPPEDLRSAIRSTLHSPAALPDPDAIVHSSFEPEPGIIAERVSYRTQHGLRVPAILYRPRQAAPGAAPGLIVVNGHGGDKYAWYAFYAGVLYARAGAVVLTYDPIGEGERNSERKSGTRAHDKVLDEEMGRRMGGLMMTDLRQAVSYLSSRGEVDSKRIGAMGYSMGSFVLGLGCAVETRLRACVLVGGGNLDGPGEYWDGSKPMCQGWPYQALRFLGDRPAALYALHASHARTLLYNGTEDSTVAIPRRDWVEGFRDLRSRVRNVPGMTGEPFETGWSKGTAHRPYFVTAPVAEWLEGVLDFPRWSAKQIAAMPVSRIGDWADRNGIEMDKLYKTEEREAGTPALGKDVPGYTRDVLSVIPGGEWDRVKADYVYESWVERERRSAGP